MGEWERAMKKGTKVTHHFRGEGVVVQIKNSLTALVEFKDGKGDGLCYLMDLYPINEGQPR